MKIGILTFQFAYNFGAQLQAFALKNYLNNKGFDVEVIPFLPKRFSDEYSANPFKSAQGIRGLIEHFFRIPRFLKQKKIFDLFLLDKMNLNKPFSSEDELYKYIKKFDIVICGSDQIFNDDITGKTSAYFLGASEEKPIKIAYAASFGNDELSDYQKDCCINFLPSFKAVSVREELSLYNLKKLNINSQVVVDPVFLMDESFFINNMKKPNKKFSSEYILYYSLRDDENLIEKLKEFSQEKKLEIIIIHPTGNGQKVKGNYLYGIGPQEFLWLIKNAKYVFTNSFHAVAFSVIFKKEIFYSLHKQRGSRVLNILNLMGDKVLKENDFVDFNNMSYDRLNELIENSVEFLDNQISKEKQYDLR